MNTTTSKKVTVLMINLMFFMYSFSLYSNNSIMEWYGNQNFTFLQNQEELNVSINKNPWESFSLKIDNFELMDNPIVKLQVRSDQDVDLRIDITDGNFVSCEKVIFTKSISSSESYSEISFNFSQVLSDINLAEETYLLFYVNPGKKFEGQISVKDVELLKNSDNKESEVAMNEMAAGLNIYPSPATDHTFVEIPEGNFSLLKVFDATGKEVASVDVQHFAGNEYKLDLNELTDGYYVVSIASDNKTLTGKLIIR